MRKVIDLTNQRFGRLVALRREKVKGTVQWRCACKCGKVCSVSSSNLRRGNTRSCGCLRDPGPDAAFHGLLKAYKKTAASRGRDFELTNSQFRNITKQKCYYCGTEPAQRFRGSKINSEYDYVYNGIDRKDNSRGYSPDNCVASCKICNAMKAIHTPEFFLSHVEKIHRNNSRKNLKPSTRLQSQNPKF